MTSSKYPQLWNLISVILYALAHVSLLVFGRAARILIILFFCFVYFSYEFSRLLVFLFHLVSVVVQVSGWIFSQTSLLTITSYEQRLILMLCTQVNSAIFSTGKPTINITFKFHRYKTNL